MAGPLDGKNIAILATDGVEQVELLTNRIRRKIPCAAACRARRSGIM
jgi:hypothetical protein